MSERIGKWSAALALAAYVIGLLTTALYLYQLDVPLPDLVSLKPRFVYTGALVLAGVMIGGVPVLFTAYGLSDGRGSTNALHAVTFLAATFAFVCAGYLLVAQRNDGQAFITSAGWDPVVLSLLDWGIVTGLILLLITAKSSRGTHQDRVALTVGLLMATGGLLLWYLVRFSAVVLPAVPDQYGGTEPSRAQFVLLNDAVPAARALGLTVRSQVTEPVSLLYLGDEFLVLRTDDGAIVQIRRDLVSGASMDSKEPTAVSVRTRDVAGSPGVAQRGDQLILRYSEPLDPASLLSGWDGSELAVAIRIEPSDSGAGISVYDAARRVPSGLGNVALRSQRPSVETPSWLDGTLTQNGDEVVLTLGEPLPLATAGRGTIMFWAVASDPTDAAGNHVRSDQVQEDDDNPDPRPEF
jgi:hypothetical protein